MNARRKSQFERINEAFNEEDDQINECNSSEVLEVAEERISGEASPNSMDISKLSCMQMQQQQYTTNKGTSSQDDFQIENLITMIIHDFRTPLFCIALMLEKLKDEKLANQEQIESLEIIETNTTLLENYVNDILDLKQLNLGKLSISPEQFTLQTFVQNITKVMQPLASLKQTKISLDYQYESSFTVNTDQRRLKQILVNLLSNAIKFTNQGSIEVKVFQVFGNFIQFSVQDNGCGIKPEILPLLGQPYKTFNQNGMNKQGIGLGLVFCKRLIGKLGPDEQLKIESIYGQGSMFSFKIFRNLNKIYSTQEQFKSQIFQTEIFEDYYSSLSKISKSQGMKSPRIIHTRSSSKNFSKQNILQLPQQKTKECDQQFSARSAHTNFEINEHLDSNIKSMSQQMIKFSKEISQNLGEAEEIILINILLVDDSPFNLMIIENYLKLMKEIKYIIHKAYNGQEAIEIFKKYNLITSKSNLQMIVMDCEMPIINGYKATQIIKNLITEQFFIPVIIIANSAHQDQNSMELCQEAQFDGVLKKPSTMTEFQQFIQQIIFTMAK